MSTKDICRKIVERVMPDSCCQRGKARLIYLKEEGYDQASATTCVTIGKAFKDRWKDLEAGRPESSLLVSVHYFEGGAMMGEDCLLGYHFLKKINRVCQKSLTAHLI